MIMNKKILQIFFISFFLLKCDSSNSKVDISYESISVSEKNGNIYLLDPNSNKDKRVTKDKLNLAPILSPNKMFIVYIKRTPENLLETRHGDFREANSVWLYNIVTKKHRHLIDGGYFDGENLIYENFGNIFFSENSEITFYHDSNHILFTGAGGSGGSILFKLNIKSMKIEPIYYSVHNFQLINFAEILIHEKKYYRNKGGFYYNNVMIDINGNVIN